MNNAELIEKAIDLINRPPPNLRHWSYQQVLYYKDIVRWVRKSAAIDGGRPNYKQLRHAVAAIEAIIS